MRTFYKRLVLLACLALPFAGQAMAGEGMVVVKSNHTFSVTANRLVATLKEKGMTVMNRFSHSANAKTIGMELRATELVTFGNPKVGTPLMQCAQSVAIDLPQKALIWEDAAGEVWFGYNDPMYLKERHSIEGCDPVLAKIAGALASFAKAATQ